MSAACWWAVEQPTERVGAWRVVTEGKADTLRAAQVAARAAAELLELPVRLTITDAWGAIERHATYRDTLGPAR